MKNQILLLSIVLTGIGACTQDNKYNRTAIEKLEDFQGQYIDDFIRLDSVIFAEVGGSAINPGKKLKTARLAYSLFDIKDLDHPIKEFREIYTEKLLLRTLNLHEEVNLLLRHEPIYSEVVLVYKYGNRGDVATVRFKRNIDNSYGYVETVSEWAEAAEILVDKALEALPDKYGYTDSKSEFKRLKMEELYNKLIKFGDYTKSFDEFVSQYGTVEKAKRLFDRLSSDGSYTKSFEEFISQYGFDGAEDPDN